MTSILLVLLPELRRKLPLSKYVDILEYNTKETDNRVYCRANYTRTIHCTENDGGWYFYLKCFAYKNSKRAYKNTNKNCKSFKLDKSNDVSIGMTAIKPYLAIRPVAIVWFARYFGKMYSCHLFSYGGLCYPHVTVCRSVSSYLWDLVVVLKLLVLFFLNKVKIC